MPAAHRHILPYAQLPRSHHAAFDSVSITLVAFLGLLRAMHVADAMLFNIPFHEEAAPQQFTRSKNLRIADLNDVQALKMT